MDPPETRTMTAITDIEFDDTTTTDELVRRHDVAVTGEFGDDVSESTVSVWIHEIESALYDRADAGDIVAAGWVNAQ